MSTDIKGHCYKDIQMNSRYTKKTLSITSNQKMQINTKMIYYSSLEVLYKDKYVKMQVLVRIRRKETFIHCQQGYKLVQLLYKINAGSPKIKADTIKYPTMYPWVVKGNEISVSKRGVHSQVYCNLLVLVTFPC